MDASIRKHKSVIPEGIYPLFQAIADDLNLLVILHGEELNPERLLQLKDVAFPAHLGLSLKSERAIPVLQAMSEAVTNWPENPRPDQLDRLHVDFANIYLNYVYRASPEESVWVDDDHLAMQQSMFDVREIYQRHGLEAANWRLRPDDHLVSQLQFTAHILTHEPDTETLEELAHFLDNHLLRWLPYFSQRVAQRSETEFYASLALLTGLYCEELRDLLALILDQSRTPPEPLEKSTHGQGNKDQINEAYIPGIAESW